jgi:hypothetical protein
MIVVVLATVIMRLFAVAGAAVDVGSPVTGSSKMLPELAVRWRYR